MNYSWWQMIDSEGIQLKWLIPFGQLIILCRNRREQLLPVIERHVSCEQQTKKGGNVTNITYIYLLFMYATCKAACTCAEHMQAAKLGIEGIAKESAGWAPRSKQRSVIIIIPIRSYSYLLYSHIV